MTPFSERIVSECMEPLNKIRGDVVRYLELDLSEVTTKAEAIEKCERAAASAAQLAIMARDFRVSAITIHEAESLHLFFTDARDLLILSDQRNDGVAPAHYQRWGQCNFLAGCVAYSDRRLRTIKPRPVRPTSIKGREAGRGTGAGEAEVRLKRRLEPRISPKKPSA